VHLLLGVLQVMHLFLPRLIFGKVVATGQTTVSAGASAGFQGLKRDLVRLLGILSHDSREVQDRVRGCEGIEAVLNMCVIDDQNPCTYGIFRLLNHGTFNH
jgi:ataxin-10